MDVGVVPCSSSFGKNDISVAYTSAKSASDVKLAYDKETLCGGKIAVCLGNHYFDRKQDDLAQEHQDATEEAAPLTKQVPENNESAKDKNTEECLQMSSD